MIITDTSVFYDIAEGKVKPNWFKNDQLTASFMNLFELSSSPNIVNGRMSKVRGAANAIKEQCATIIEIEAYDFLLEKLIPDYKYSNTKWNNVQRAFQDLQKSVFIETEFNKEIGKAVINSFRKPLTDSVNKINLMLAQRGQIKKVFKNQLTQTNVIETEKQELLMALLHNGYIKDPKDVIVAANSYGWKNFEFFLNVWSDFMKEFIYKQGKKNFMKLDVNDWADLWIMVYVGKEDSFYTMEKFWIDLIKRNPITAKYLHPLSGKRK